MIRLFSLKQQKKDGEAAPKNTQKRSSAAQLRITKGMCHPYQERKFTMHLPLVFIR